MQKWIVTGISGSGRTQLVEEIKTHAKNLGKSIEIHDIAALICKECKKNRIKFTEQRILDLDHNLLRTLRSCAMKELKIRIHNNSRVDLHLISIHATFRWRRRLIPGISYRDLIVIRPDGFINVIDDVKEVFQRNRNNPKWEQQTSPNIEETQEWMIEEEFVTESLAEVVSKPIYLVAKKHEVSNLTELFFSQKKKVYLSYPITAVREESPELLDKIQGPILKQLQELFVVFNPLAIKDMEETYNETDQILPNVIEPLTIKAKEIIKTRTIERDFQFIDQADAVVVFYMTEKLSAGVLAEIQYAHRNQKPVYVVYKGSGGPFLEYATTFIAKDIESLIERLKEFAQSE